MPVTADPQLVGLVGAAHAAAPRTVALRRLLHRRPEQGLRLPLTRAAVLDGLAGLPLEVHTGRAVSSVVAVLRGSRPGPTVLLRADMDALPLSEETGLPYASEISGSMHACGHDMHAAMLASATRLLCQRREQLAGQVLLMFQPGEEGHHGARHMIDEGLLETVGAGDAPSRAYALHVSATIPSGTVQTRGGPIMAAVDLLRVTVRGRGGHASAPHDAMDPIPAAAAMVGALQTMLTRRMSAFEPVVLTVGQIHAGTTSNVIPETAFLEATIRTLSPNTRAFVRDEARRTCEHTAAAYGCTTSVEIEPGYPITVNEPTAADQVDAVAARLLGPSRVTPMPTPIMGAEDFSYVLDRVPGALAFVGAAPPGVEPDAAAPNHSNRVVFDEAAMVDGVALYAALALDALRPA